MVVHISVLVGESLELLNISASGHYIDATVGGGGHSKKILEQLSLNGKIDAFDTDSEACKIASKVLNSPQVRIINDNFSAVLHYVAKESIDGVLADLGTSAHQLSTPHRGFSFMHSGPLDMRLNPKSKVTCKSLLSTITQKELAQILRHYGEERHAFKLARLIKKQRRNIHTTLELANLVKQAIPRPKKIHPATRTFQALRMAVNDEVTELVLGLTNLFASLRNKGRMVIISFHAGEDRIVKRMMQSWIKKGQAILIAKMPASFNEISINNKARSAYLRCVEKILIEDY